MDDLTDAIDAILADATRDADEERSEVDAIEALYAAWGWDVVRDRMMSILEDSSRRARDWETVAAVFWGAVLDGRSVDADRLIALLCVRLPFDEGSTESNLAWSITARLKSTSYLSDYDPRADPGVRRQLEKLSR